MFEMKLTDPGEGLLEAEIVRWLVHPGDAVRVNDLVVEVETAKSLVELPSPFEGVVGELRASEGDVVEVGSVLLTVLAAGEQHNDGASRRGTPRHSSADVTVAEEPASPTVAEESARGTSRASRSPASPTTVAEEPVRDERASRSPQPESSGSILVGYGTSASAVSRRPRKGRVVAEQPATDQVHESYGLEDTPGHRTEEQYRTQRVTHEPQDPPLPHPREGDRPGGVAVAEPGSGPAAGVRALAKPTVRRLARDLGVDLATVGGTGPNGSITPTDVAQAAVGSSSGRRGPTRIPLRGVRREMVKAMTEAMAVPHASVWMDVDVTNTVALIDSLKQRREFASLRVSPIILLAKAVCLAIERHPEVNSTIDLERGEILVHGDVNLGIAAATSRGLVVPNVKRANELNLLELAQALNQLVTTVREGRLTPADAASGTFTITNVGVFGVEGGTPLLNPGESAIMLLGTFRRRPWVVGAGDEERIEPRWVATLTLTIDHRVLDGEQASRFLKDVATILEDPGLALLY